MSTPTNDKTVEQAAQQMTEDDFVKLKRELEAIYLKF